jgi:hypothetical protein
MHKISGVSTEALNRRKFLTTSGERALWVAPTIATLLMASATPARAQGGYQREHDPKNLWEFLFRRRKNHH